MMTDEFPKSDKNLTSAANKLKERYNELLAESATLYPKVDQRLSLDILKFETPNIFGEIMFTFCSFRGDLIRL